MSHCVLIIAPYKSFKRRKNIERIARYEITLNDGYLSNYLQFTIDVKPKNPEYTWDVYIETLDEGVNIYDLLSKTQQNHGLSTTKDLLVLPFAEDFLETYQYQYEMDFLDTLPELVWEPILLSSARYYFYNHICDRFAFDNEQQSKEPIPLNIVTGTNTNLYNQTRFAFDCMRIMGASKTIFDENELLYSNHVTEKEIQSISQQYGLVDQAHKPIVRVAVLHPLESFWMYLGPNDMTSRIRQELETDLTNITDWLLFGQIDFNFISEELLSDLYVKTSEKTFHVGHMIYDVVLIPNCKSLRSHTVNALACFAKHGGKVVFAGELPEYIDGIEARLSDYFLADCTFTPFARSSVLNTLSEYQDIRIITDHGFDADWLTYKLIETNNRRILEITCQEEELNLTNPNVENIIITVSGLYIPTLLDFQFEPKEQLYHKQDSNKTKIFTQISKHESLVISLHR